MDTGGYLAPGIGSSADGTFPDRSNSGGRGWTCLGALMNAGRSCLLHTLAAPLLSSLGTLPCFHSPLPLCPSSPIHHRPIIDGRHRYTTTAYCSPRFSHLYGYHLLHPLFAQIDKSPLLSPLNVSRSSSSDAVHISQHQKYRVSTRDQATSAARPRRPTSSSFPNIDTIDKRLLTALFFSHASARACREIQGLG